jgi:hypothetical protein
MPIRTNMGVFRYDRLRKTPQNALSNTGLCSIGQRSWFRQRY